MLARTRGKRGACLGIGVCFLCFLLGVTRVAGSAASLTFGVDRLQLRRNGTYVAQYYAGLKRHARSLPVRWDSSSEPLGAAGLAPMIIKARGRSVVWPAAVFDARFAADSVQWARWRYMVASNVSLTVTNTRPSLAIAANRQARLVCALSTTVYCDAGRYVVAGHGNYTVLVDPTRVRGALPAHLFFLLTSGRTESRSSLRRPLVSSLTPAVAAATRCLTLVPTSRMAAPTSLVLCDDDAAYFDMQTQQDSDELVIGGAFWRHNASLVIADGRERTLTVQFAPVDPATVLAWQWTGVALFAVSIMLYAAWALGGATFSLALYMLHVTRADGHTEWPLSWPLVIGGCLLLPVGAAAAVVGWLGGTSAGVFGGAPAVVANLDFVTLATTVTVYLGVQIAIAAGAFIGWEWPRLNRGGCAALRTHRVSVRVAWVRNMTMATGALAAAVLAQLPLAFVGGLNGDTVLLFFPLPTALLLLYHHTYYALVLVAVAIGSRDSRAITGVIAFVQFAVLAALATVVGLTYLRPVLANTAVLFADSYMAAAASHLIGFVIGAALLVTLFETRRGLVWITHGLWRVSETAD